MCTFYIRVNTLDRFLSLLHRCCWRVFFSTDLQGLLPQRTSDVLKLNYMDCCSSILITLVMVIVC